MLCFLGATPDSGRAQILLDSIENIDYDRPEAWAMKYFTAVSLMSGFGQVGLEPGEVRLGFEGAWVPSLSAEERRVGFIGSKVEDLNRASAFGRLRAEFGLPARWNLTVGYVPPLEIDGVTPEIFNLSLGRHVVARRRWRLSARLTVQSGALGGDLTCPEDVVGSSDPGINPDDCLEPSDDEVSMDYLGLEWTYARVVADSWQPYLSASINHFDLNFQVRARYGDFQDRTRLFSAGWTPSLALGTRYQSEGRTSLAAEVFYAPLDVVRDVTRGARDEGLLSARLLVEYRAR